MKTASNRAKNACAKLGLRGERTAEKLLRAKGMDILARNWKSGSGELDIVARDGDMLVFVEVKSRRASSLAAPQSNLSPGQVRRIRLGANKYLARIEASSVPYRYDLIEVRLGSYHALSITHHQNCYQARRK